MFYQDDLIFSISVFVAMLVVVEVVEVVEVVVVVVCGREDN